MIAVEADEMLPTPLAKLFQHNGDVLPPSSKVDQRNCLCAACMSPSPAGCADENQVLQPGVHGRKSLN
jgi:hypothetical protein